MWGSPIDFDIVEKISRYEKLEDILSKNNCISAEGYIIGKNGRTTETRLKEMPLVDSQDVDNYLCKVKPEKKLDTDIFYRVPRSKFEIFLKPHLLIRKNVVKAAFLQENAAFTHSILGIHGEDINLLKYISTVVNSELMQYYFFLTASTFTVERKVIHSGEIRNMPIRMPERGLLEKIVKLHDIIQKELTENKDASGMIRELNGYVYQAYSITPLEAKIIRDTLVYDLSIFEDGVDSVSYKKINKKILKDYVTTLLKRINRILGLSNKYMNAHVYYSSDCPLELIVLSVDDEEREVEIIENDDPIDAKLRQVDVNLSETFSQSISIKKDLRLYLRDSIVLIRFNERRFWSFKQAVIESNRLISELATGGRNE